MKSDLMLVQRIANERTFSEADGAAIFYRHWPSQNQQAPKRAIILFHRGHEHSGRQQAVVDSLEMPNYDCFAWDARGLGKSPGVRGFAENFGVFVKDANDFANPIYAGIARLKSKTICAVCKAITGNNASLRHHQSLTSAGVC